MSFLIITTRVPVCPECASAIASAAPVSRFTIDSEGSSVLRTPIRAAGDLPQACTTGATDPTEITRRKAGYFEILLGLLKILACPTDPNASDLRFWRARATRAIARAEAILDADPEAP